MSDYNRDNTRGDRYNRDDTHGGDREGYRGGERRSYGDRDNFRGGERRSYGDRDNFRGGDRDGGYGQRREGGFGGRRDFGDRRGGQQQQPRNKWTQEEEEQLKTLVAQQKDQGQKVDWDAIGKQLNSRYGSSCFNKFTQLSEKEWTAEEEEVLGKWWQDNNQQTQDVNLILEKLNGHSKRGAQFKLERLTQEGRFNPAYRMGKEEMQRCD